MPVALFGRFQAGVCHGPRYYAPMKSRLILLLIATCTPGLPKDSYQSILIIERSTNANVVHYDAKIRKDGTLDLKEPMVAYWVMVAVGGGRQELSRLEKSHVYGFTMRKDSSGESYWMTLVSQKARTIHIYQEGGKVRAVTSIGAHEEGRHPSASTFVGSVK